jgi:hypothetical protein
MLNAKARHRPDATGGRVPSGAGRWFAGEKSDGRVTRVTRQLRARGGLPESAGSR